MLTLFSKRFAFVAVVSILTLTYGCSDDDTSKQDAAISDSSTALDSNSNIDTVQIDDANQISDSSAADSTISDLMTSDGQTLCPQDNSTQAECSTTTVAGLNGLLWQLKPACFDAETWDVSNSYCEDLILCGHKGWRLPTLDELTGLLDNCDQNVQDTFPGYCDACDASTQCNSMFATNIGDDFWSSTLWEKDQDLAWYVSFRSGAVGNIIKTLKSNMTRCVYDGS